MFKRCEKIYKAVLQPEQDNPKDISYRGQGLSNEYRLSLPSGLLRHNKATSFKRIFTSPKEETDNLLSFTSSLLKLPPNFTLEFNVDLSTCFNRRNPPPWQILGA